MLAFKFAISIAIIALSGYVGMYQAKKLKNREYILRDMVTFLGLVENEIKYMLSILPNAYEASRQKLLTELKNVIGRIVEDMLEANYQTQIEQSIVENISNIKDISDYDKNVFISTLRNLGNSDLDGQINIIKNSIATINNQIKEANEIKLKNSKLYRTVGVIAGIMIVIICI